MMLKYLKANTLEELQTNIAQNLDKYISGEAFIKDDQYISSSIRFKKFELKNKDNNSNYDFENSVSVYESLKHLSLLEAIDERIWVGLAHSPEAMKYSQLRWKITKDTSISSINDRFFSKSKRNSISRLWWYGYLSYSNKFEDPYQLTEILAKNHDFAEGILGRSFSKNKKVVLIILEAFYKWTTEMKNPFPNRDIVRGVFKELNRISSITLLDFIEIDDVIKYLKKYSL